MKKFTFILAIAMMTLFIPVKGWGQTKGTETVTYGFESTDNAWTITGFTTVTNSTTAHGGSKYGSTNSLQSPTTCNVMYSSIIASPKSFSCWYTKTSGNTNSSSKFVIQTSTDGSTWTTRATGLTMNNVNQGTWYELTADLSSYSEIYVRVGYDGTTALRAIDDISLTYEVSGTCTVTYDCNGGESGCPTNVSDIEPGTSITLAAAPTKLHYNFTGWKSGETTYNAGASYTVNSNVTFTAQWESDGTLGEGSICFSTQQECTAINSTSVTGDDNLGNTWAITTEGTNSFTANSAYYQVGSGNTPASKITFTTTLDEEVNVTDFSASFGGFNATRASVVLKVDNTQVGSGTLNGSADVTVSSSSAQTGTTLTVIVTPSAGGVKCYNISYTYEISTNPSLRITTPEELAYSATSGSIGFTIKNPVATASVQASVPEGSWITLGTVGENSIPFNCTANPESSERSETVTFVYVNGEETLDTKTVTVTQAAAPQQYTLTVSLGNNVNAIFVFDDPNGSPLIEDGAEGSVSVLGGTSIEVSPDVAEGCVLQSLMVGNTDVTSQMTGGSYTFTMTGNVTITAMAEAVPTYTLATTIENGRHYIITNGDNYAMGAQSGNGNNRTAIGGISTNGTTATVTSADVREVVINGPDANGYYTIYDAAHPGYLYCGSSDSKSYLKTRAFNGQTDNLEKWAITFSEGAAIITSAGRNDRNVIQFNSTLFNCYTSGYDDIYLYVKNEATPQYDFYMDIAKWTTGASDKWYFIASPLANAYTLSGTDMVSGTYADYDLYRLNNTTWENYNNTEHSDFTALNNGTGYLYANSNNTTLHFSGAINTYTTDNYANEKSLSAGWNLIGNPYSIPIYINKPYYTLNETGNAILATEIKNVAIAPCTGVIVNDGNGDNVIFTESSQNITAGNNGNIQMTLTQEVTTRGNRSAITLDNAIVSFNEGSQLEKFYFGQQDANIYIPQGNEEFAIASSDMQGEMPVNFKAAENGQYTISVNTEDVEMNYLHLIDNLTGVDTDLLATPSYTFNAKNDDYASRFRLVFSANNANNTEIGNDNFAFISNGQIVLTEQGNARVYDITGRMISSHNNVNHITTEGMAAGVYVLQLVNDGNVKTQKIVVK